MSGADLNNGYFVSSDITAHRLLGYEIPSSWWSRIYEYPWALKYAFPKDVCADMGSGEYYRPFKDCLARTCKTCYAVDLNPDRMDYSKKVVYIQADFTERIEQLSDQSLDKIYCISVLEEVDCPQKTLNEFYRLLKPGGIAVLTFDCIYDHEKAVGKYKGIEPSEFGNWVKESGFHYYGSAPNYNHTNGMIFNEKLNLCVFHSVLQK